MIMRAMVVFPSPLRPTNATFSPRAMVSRASLNIVFSPKARLTFSAITTLSPARGASGKRMDSVELSSGSTSMSSIFSSCFMRDCTWLLFSGL